MMIGRVPRGGRRFGPGNLVGKSGRLGTSRNGWRQAARSAGASATRVEPDEAHSLTSAASMNSRSVSSGERPRRKANVSIVSESRTSIVAPRIAARIAQG